MIIEPSGILHSTICHSMFERKMRCLPKKSIDTDSSCRRAKSRPLRRSCFFGDEPSLPELAEFWQVIHEKQNSISLQALGHRERRCIDFRYADGSIFQIVQARYGDLFYMCIGWREFPEANIAEKLQLRRPVHSLSVTTDLTFEQIHERLGFESIKQLAIWHDCADLGIIIKIVDACSVKLKRSNNLSELIVVRQPGSHIDNDESNMDSIADGLIHELSQA